MIIDFHNWPSWFREWDHPVQKRILIGIDSNKTNEFKSVVDVK